jgi:hypothetical protein
MGWSGNNQFGNAAAGASVALEAVDNMVFTSLRCYLP